MKHIATLFSVLALLACSKHEAATPATKPVETVAPGSALAIPAHFGTALSDYLLFSGGQQQLTFANGAARAALVQVNDAGMTIVRLVVAGPKGAIELQSQSEPQEIQYGLFAADDDVVAVQVTYDKHSGEAYVLAQRIVLQNDDVMITQAFEADSPTTKLPLWIPGPVRERQKAAAAAAAAIEAENDAARIHDRDTDENSETEEELEEAAMTDAVEKFEAPAGKKRAK